MGGLGHAETPKPRRATDAPRNPLPYPLPPPPPPQAAPSRSGGSNRGTATARGESAQRRADAAASRGSPPGHASPGRGRTHGLGLGREPPVPTGREPRGVGRGAGTDRGRAAGKEGTAEAGGAAGPAGRREAPPAKGRTVNDGGPKTRPHTTPHHPRGPPPATRHETIPNTPDTPRANTTQRPLAARGSSRRGRRQPRRPGASARAQIPPSLLPTGRAPPPPATEAGGGDTVSALRGTEGPAALRGHPQPRNPRGGVHMTHTHPGGAIDRQATLRQA